MNKARYCNHYPSPLVCKKIDSLKHLLLEVAHAHDKILITVILTRRRTKDQGLLLYITDRDKLYDDFVHEIISRSALSSISKTSDSRQ